MGISDGSKTFECDSDAGQRVRYTPTGSGNGIESILKNVVDFAGTDVLIKNSTFGTHNTNSEAVLLIPSLATAICATANIPGFPIGEDFRLVLSKELLANIFSGVIQFWDHEKILAENPNFLLFLPHEKIRLVAREDRSGTTAIFTRALSSFVANFTPGVGKLVAWPPSTLKGQQNSGLLQIVSSTPYSIGYAVVGDVKRHKDLHCVNFHNGENVPITPTVESVHKAISLAQSTSTPYDLLSQCDWKYIITCMANFKLYLHCYKNFLDLRHVIPVWNEKLLSTFSCGSTLLDSPWKLQKNTNLLSCHTMNESRFWRD